MRRKRHEPIPPADLDEPFGPPPEEYRYRCPVCGEEMLVNEQNPENLSRKGYAPIIGEPRRVTWGAYISVVFYSGDHSHADPQTALFR